MWTRRSFLRVTATAPVVSGGTRHLFAAEFDLVIKGGRVIDPSQKIDRVADVAIRGSRIAAIRPGIPESSAAQILEAGGRIVTPGLIDIHTHVADPDNTPAQCLADGVTSLVDGGSRGAENVDEFLKTAQRAPNRVRILLNLGKRGLAPQGELMDLANADVPAARRAVEQHREWIVGLKVRLSRTIAGDHDVEALRLGRQVADPLKIPIMIHMGQTASPLPELLNLLRPGDIVTHVYAPAPNGIMDQQNRVLPAVREARRRGVLFDIGNGRLSHITWEIAEKALQQDFPPDTISSDITGAGREEHVVNFPNVLSKFLLLGMPLDQVIARATVNAAHAIPEFKSYGTLRTGAAADVTILELKEGNFEFIDNAKTKRTGRQKLVPFAAVVGGKRA